MDDFGFFWWLGFKSDGAAAKRTLTCRRGLVKVKGERKDEFVVNLLLFLSLYGSAGMANQHLKIGNYLSKALCASLPSLPSL